MKDTRNVGRSSTVPKHLLWEVQKFKKFKISLQCFIQGPLPLSTTKSAFNVLSSDARLCRPRNGKQEKFSAPILPNSSFVCHTRPRTFLFGAGVPFIAIPNAALLLTPTLTAPCFSSPLWTTTTFSFSLSSLHSPDLLLVNIWN
jgi:hypothetical protein